MYVLLDSLQEHSSLSYPIIRGVIGPPRNLTRRSGGSLHPAGVFHIHSIRTQTHAISQSC
eukprot:COSAG01_NODE_1441_length_10293_cov_4.232392_2_plen_60_part_00